MQDRVDPLKKAYDTIEEILGYLEEDQQTIATVTAERDLAEQQVGSLQDKVAKLEADVAQLKAENKSLNDTIDVQAFMLQPPVPSDWADFDY